MLLLQRTHDFQLFIAPQCHTEALTNPPSFNWPHHSEETLYDVTLRHLDSEKTWHFNAVQSPLQIDTQLPIGHYEWQISTNGDATEWMPFFITADTPNYLAPSAQALFELCRDRSQFLMYFDEDMDAVRAATPLSVKEKLQQSIGLIDLETIQYPNHYRRGLEEGKRTAITNVRSWIDCDLIALTLLYKIWNDEAAGEFARQLLLRLSEWSPEGPASLLRPCRWGDEVGLSLSRNLYLAYHWLSPLLTDDERSIVRPLLIRIAYQMEERLMQDQFHQFPGHSHTSRLPAYLGVAALALHKEFDVDVCERWLSYALMIYRGVLPFYGGRDGSWAEGPFYSSSYSKWQHPFFLSVERLSQFSFYNHPFYQNYVHFAVDFVATPDRIHPFSDGFWCQREGKEWPGFFAQNPLRLYADRFGDASDKALSDQLESEITHYKLHLLDIIPTVTTLNAQAHNTAAPRPKTHSIFYPYAGLGKLTDSTSSLHYRACEHFGNSSHRHADQGNFAFMVHGLNVLSPSGSYGYRFGSKHHSLWTRTTQAHNLPLIAGKGQTLDSLTSTARQIAAYHDHFFQSVTLDLSAAYEECHTFLRTLILVGSYGMLTIDQIQLKNEAPLQWRVHTPFTVHQEDHTLTLTSPPSERDAFSYQLSLQAEQHLLLAHEVEEINDTDGFFGAVESDAQKEMTHLEWETTSKKDHLLIMCCYNRAIESHYSDQNVLTLQVENHRLIYDLKTQTITSD